MITYIPFWFAEVEPEEWLALEDVENGVLYTSPTCEALLLSWLVAGGA